MVENAVTSATDDSTTSPDRLRWRPFALTRLFIGAVCLTVFVAVLAMNGGMLTYTLDDAYIQLSVSEQIWRGHYGVNPGEFSSPSSSVLYPFLLALGAFSPVVHEYLPLAIGLVSLFTTVEILRIFLMRIGFGLNATSVAIAAAFVAAASICFNLICILFVGMEHSLHVMLTAAAILGFVVFLEEGRATWWFLASVVLSPLVRYEGLALSLPIIVCLFWCGRRKTAIALAAPICAVLGAFSAILMAHGLPMLPESILQKSAQVERITESGGGSLWQALVEAVRANLSNPAGLLVGAMGVIGVAVLWGDWRRRTLRSETLVAIVLASLVAGQEVLGQFGWWGRYEVYALVGGAMMALYLTRDAVARQLAQPIMRSRLAIAGLSFLFLVGMPYYRLLAVTPLSANNLYETQYMMHRFIVDKFKGPVAVHDLGWASYQNENYVFDMLGLGSEEARKARPRSSLFALDPIIKAHGIKLAVLCRGWWLGNPPLDWTCVGAIHLSRRKATADRMTPEYCATSPQYADEIRRLLTEFKAEVPPRINVEVYPPGHP